MKNGFADSGIRMNTWIAQKDKWTLEELEERSQYLSDRAMEIWKAPVTAYEPPKKQYESYTLADGAELTGRFVAKFAFKGTEQPVESWKEMYQKVLQVLFAENRSILEQLAYSNEQQGLALSFSTNGKKEAKWTEISDGIYVWTNNNTKNKMDALSRVFELYGEDPGELVFYLRNTASTADEDVPGSIYETRRKYWAKALPLIQKEPGADKAFDKVTPRKENWVSGYFGISRFTISCVAISNEARVEVKFSRPDAQVNKGTFDRLAAHKAEIEAKLGTALQWERGEGYKSAKVFVKLDGVSVEHEADWPQMIEFHKNWAKKFLDVIIPLVQAEFVG